jgi:hypothetical protein
LQEANPKVNFGTKLAWELGKYRVSSPRSISAILYWGGREPVEMAMLD